MNAVYFKEPIEVIQKVSPAGTAMVAMRDNQGMS